MAAILEARTAQDSDTPATPVFAAPIGHPSAWTVADFRSPADYSVDLDAAQLRDIAAAVRRIKAAGIGQDGLQREHFEVPSLRPVVEEIRRQVEDGRGSRGRFCRGARSSGCVALNGSGFGRTDQATQLEAAT